jgi:hypothetical protein
MEVFIDWALFLSVVICIAEIVMGVLVIIGGKIKLMSYLMMLMMVFFTFLTWHTSTCDHDVKFVDHDTYYMSDPGDKALVDIKLAEATSEYNRVKTERKAAKSKKEKSEIKRNVWLVSKSKEEVVIGELKSPQCVDDCGCFGDAMKGSVGRSLTPQESLWKDIILVYLVLWIFLAQWIIKPNTKKENLIFSSASMLVVIFFSWVFGWYFPIFFALVSILGALWILRVGKNILGNHYGSALIVTILCVILVTYVLMYNPIKDYRPYAVGADLVEKMNDGVEGEYVSMLVYRNKKNGKEREYDGTSDKYINSKIWEDTANWEFAEMRQKAIVEQVNPSIMDFNPAISIEDLSDLERNSMVVKPILDTSMVQKIKFFDIGYQSEGEVPIEEYSIEGFPSEEYEVLDTISSLKEGMIDIEIKDAILAQDQIVIVVSKKLEDGTWSNLKKIKAIQKECKKKGIPFIMICNATRESINDFRKKHKFDVAAFSMDEIELKVISRSNPSILILEKGVVKGKYPYRSIPSIETFRSKHLK